MKLHRVMMAASVAAAAMASAASAQSPSVLYTWDHSFGAGLGANLEAWSVAFGANAGTTSIDNTTDGILTITESVAGGDWAISDGYNTPKESAGAFTFGGVDLLGLDTLEIDLSHNGTGDISGSIFFQPDNGGGCCGWFSSDFTASPGANTISVDLNALGMTPDDAEYVRALGIQVWGNAEPAPVTFEVSEIRTGGTPLNERVIADYTTAPGDLDQVVVKFDADGVAGGTGDTQDGLTLLDNALRWVDVADASGGAVAWGNGNALTVGFASRPLDISNYDYAKVVMKATGGAGADAELPLHFYTQFADTAANNEYAYASVETLLPVDGEYHELIFPLADLGANNLDLVQWLGLNLHQHAGNMQIQVQSVVLGTIPEPTAAVLLVLAGVAGVATRRRQG